jgi:hypothetical protein
MFDGLLAASKRALREVIFERDGLARGTTHGFGRGFWKQRLPQAGVEDRPCCIHHLLKPGIVIRRQPGFKAGHDAVDVSRRLEYYKMITITEINYLLDLIKEIKEGVDDGVLDELENAEEMIVGWKTEILRNSDDELYNAKYREE